MAALDKSTFDALYESLFADNTDRDIIELYMRSFKDDIKDSFLNKADELSLPLTAIAGTTTGSSNAYSVSLTYPASYATNLIAIIKANFTNTAAPTLDINTLGAKAIKAADGSTDLAAGNIQSGQYYLLIYDGTAFRLLASGGSGSSDTVTSDTAATYSVGAPGKYIHRGTGSTWTLQAGSGAIDGREYTWTNKGTGNVVLKNSSAVTVTTIFAGSTKKGYWDHAGSTWIIY